MAQPPFMTCPHCGDEEAFAEWEADGYGGWIQIEPFRCNTCDALAATELDPITMTDAELYTGWWMGKEGMTHVVVNPYVAQALRDNLLEQHTEGRERAERNRDYAANAQF